VVNRVQKTRKEIGLNVEDRIELTYEASSDLASAISTHADYISKETLCMSLTSAASPHQHQFDIDGHELKLTINKA
jgi:isoleucyl-tRNA synthetase